MSEKEILLLVSRWIHVLSAVIAVGGMLFMRFVLMPSARETLTDEQLSALRESVIGRWRKVVLVVIVLLLVSGSVNFLWVGMPKAKEVGPSYHSLFGVKFLLALGVFFLTAVLTGRSKATEGMRANAPKWLAVTAALGVLVILLGGALARLG